LARSWASTPTCLIRPSWKVTCPWNPCLPPS
jgi:hypothetical protein